jgi:hypothetical protein
MKGGGDKTADMRDIHIEKFAGIGTVVSMAHLRVHAGVGEFVPSNFNRTSASGISSPSLDSALST